MLDCSMRICIVLFIVLSTALCVYGFCIVFGFGCYCKLAWVVTVC
jgi:hypothetical protein